MYAKINLLTYPWSSISIRDICKGNRASFGILYFELGIEHMSIKIHA